MGKKGKLKNKSPGIWQPNEWSSYLVQKIYWGYWHVASKYMEDKIPKGLLRETIKMYEIKYREMMK